MLVVVRSVVDLVCPMVPARPGLGAVVLSDRLRQASRGHPPTPTSRIGGLEPLCLQGFRGVGVLWRLEGGEGRHPSL